MKFYLILGAVAVFAVIGVFYTYAVYDAGRDAERARTAKLLESARKEQRRLIDELEQANAKERVVIREKIRTVRVAQDPTACSDTDIPDAIFSQLQ